MADEIKTECPLCVLAEDGDYHAGLALMQGKNASYWMRNHLAASRMLKEQTELNIEASNRIYELEQIIANLQPTQET